MNRYWKSPYTVTVLTRGEDPPNIQGLDALHHATTEGDASGTTAEAHEEISVEQMRDELLAQGSDPSFLIPEDADT